MRLLRSGISACLPGEKRSVGARLWVTVLMVCSSAPLVALSGCAGSGDRGEDAQRSARASVARSPVLSRPVSALETRVYVLESENDAVERSLQELIRSDSAWDAPEFDRWRDNGVRVLSVDAADIDRLDTLWSSRGLSQGVQLGETTRWASAHAGPQFGALRVGTDTGLLDLSAGRLEIMARSWSVSRRSWDDDRPGVRLELVPRYRPLRDRRFADALLDGAASERDALWFDRLRAEAVTDGTRALVFLAASPLEVWSDLDPAPVGQRATRLIIAPSLPVPGEGADDGASEMSEMSEVTKTDESGGSDPEVGGDLDSEPDSPGQSDTADASVSDANRIGDAAESERPVRRLSLGSLLLPHDTENPESPEGLEVPENADGDASAAIGAQSDAGRVLTVLVVRPVLGERGRSRPAAGNQR
jgi:hypothetical protein